jgi:hypothetical protein
MSSTYKTFSLATVFMSVTALFMVLILSLIMI